MSVVIARFYVFYEDIWITYLELESGQTDRLIDGLVHFNYCLTEDL